MLISQKPHRCVTLGDVLEHDSHRQPY